VSLNLSVFGNSVSLHNAVIDNSVSLFISVFASSNVLKAICCSKDMFWVKIFRGVFGFYVFDNSVSSNIEVFINSNVLLACLLGVEFSFSM